MFHSKRKTGIIIAVMTILAVAGALALTFLLKYREKINNTEALTSYRLAYTEGSKEAVSLYETLVDDKLSKKVVKATEKSHLFLRFGLGKDEINALGYDCERINGNSFMIARMGNGLYLMADNQNALKMAVRVLLKDYVDDDGNLLIKQDEEYLDLEDEVSDICGPEGTLLSQYSIVKDTKVSDSTANLLAYYVQMSTGVSPVVTDQTDGAAIELGIDATIQNHSISFEYGDIILTGRDEEELKKAILVFANYSLGIDFAGTDREKRSSIYRVSKLPSKYEEEETPWIEQREPIITLWNTNYSRGIFLNDSTSLKTDIMSYSDEQLFNYVRMMKYCGFTGIQATDMCSAWAGAGNYELVHERLRLLADAAHAMDMKFTLWVWGAEFTGYGWADETVTYSTDGHDFVYENPEAVKCFEKYYSRYAELADCCDRVIAHYYDPGNLGKSEDVAWFAKLLRSKFKAVNPNIDFGVSCWVDVFDKNAFVKELGSDITLYENGHHDKEEDYISFRNFCGVNQCRVGTWAWNTGEMEIDQLAQMNFQPHIIQSTYETARKYDENNKPGYWSEMDSNHVVNVFSLYCEGKLLQNPDGNVSELTDSVACAAVGEEYADRFANILRLIEDARSGDSWDSFTWNSDNYIVASPDYPAADILERSEKALEVLDEMIGKESEAFELPLPISLNDFLRLIRSQVAQINSYAEFRIGLTKAEELAKAGDLEKLNALLKELSVPISEYNTVIGLWGQIEARTQRFLLLEFGEKYGVEIPEDVTFHKAQKDRIYSYFVSYQKGKQTPVLQYYPYFQYGVAYGNEETERLVKELIAEGLFIKDEETGGVYVADWEHYKYAFN